VKIAKTGPVLGEPQPSIHTYDKEEEPLQAALGEVNLDETFTVGRVLKSSWVWSFASFGYNCNCNQLVDLSKWKD